MLGLCSCTLQLMFLTHHLASPPILDSVELPSFAEVYARILRSCKEGHVGESNDGSSSISDQFALATQFDGGGKGFHYGGRRGQGPKQGRGLPRKCTNCDRDGQLRGSCWDLII
ncbi:hypothetical protein Ancab_040620 [Ancistrocladus abbreviatus]